MLTALYFAIMFNQLFEGRACTNTKFWSNFEITKFCGYREYKVKVIKILFTFFSISKQCIYASLVQKNLWFRRQSSEKAEFTVC